MSDNVYKYTISVDDKQFLDALTRDGEAVFSLARKTEKSGLDINSAFRGITKNIGNLFDVEKIKEFVKEVISVRGEIQMLEQSFTTLLGSEEKSNEMMEGIKNISSKSPISLTETSNAAQTLLAFNVEAENVIPILQQLGDISMGNGEKFNSLAQAFGQVSFTGQLVEKDLEQMINAGFNPLAIMSEKTGKAISQLKIDMEEGAISSEMVADAFSQATEEGGKFHGSMEQQSKGITGLKAAYEGAWMNMMNEIGAGNEELIAGGYELTTSLVENYEIIGKAILGLVTTYGAYRTAVILSTIAEAAGIGTTTGLTVAETLHYYALVAGTKAQALFNATMLANPAVLTTTVIIGLAAAILAFGNSVSEAEKIQNRLNDSFLESENAALTETRGLAKLKGELSAAEKGSEEYNKIKEKIVKGYGKYYSGLEDEIETVGLLDATYSKLTESIKKSFGARQYEKFIKQEQETLEKTMSKKLGGIQDRLVKKLGDEAGSKIYSKIRNAIIEGQEIKFGDGEIQSGLDKETLDALNKVAGKDGGWFDMTNREIEYNVKDILRAVTLFEKIDSKAKNRFGIDENAGGSQSSIENPSEGNDSKTPTNDLNKSKGRKTNSNNSNTNKNLNTSDAPKNVGESEAEKAQKEAQKKADIEQSIIKADAANALDRRNAQLANQEALLSLKEDGFEKEMMQNELNHKKELLAIDHYEKELIAKQQEAEKKEWEKNGSQGVFVPKTQSVTDLNYENDQLLTNRKDNSELLSEHANKKTLEKLLNQYQNYQTKRLDVEKKFQSQIEDLGKARTTENSEQIDFAIAEANKKKQEELKGINDAEADQAKKSSDLLTKLFTDSADKSVSEIKKIIDQAQELYDYLSNTKPEDITDNFNLSAGDLTSLKSKEGEIKAILDGIIAKKKELAGKSEFEAFALNIKDSIKLIEQGGTENIGKGIIGISSAIEKVLPSVKKFGKDLGGILGEGVGENIDIATKLLGSTVEIGAGVGKMMSGDVIGGIQSVVSGVSSIMAMGSEANERHREALKLINQGIKAQEHAYQIAQRLKSLEYEQGDTVFGDNPYGKAINGAKEYLNANNELKKSLKGDGKVITSKGLFGSSKSTKDSDYAELEKIKIVTGHKKTGVFGWGKGEDTYSGILVEYHKLIDEHGKFNAELAKTVIAERKMSDENKTALQNMIENAEVVEKAYAQMKDYLTNIFGSLGEGMTDALVNAFTSGEDAAQSFYDTASGLVQKLVKDMITSVVIAPILEKASTKAMKVIENTDSSDEQKLDSLMGIIDNMITEGLNAQDRAQELYDYASEAWKAKTGESLFKKPESERTGIEGKGIANASQDSISELSGRTLAAVILLTEMRDLQRGSAGVMMSFNEGVLQFVAASGELSEGMFSLTRLAQDQLTVLNTIKGDTVLLKDIKEGIDTMNLKGVKVLM